MRMARNRVRNECGSGHKRHCMSCQEVWIAFCTSAPQPGTHSLQAGTITKSSVIIPVILLGPNASDTGYKSLIPRFS